MNTQPLYAMTNEYAALVDVLEESGGELTPELEAALDALTGDISAKVERCGLMYRNLTAEAEAIATEARRLSDRSTVASKNADRLKQYVKRCLEEAGLPKVATTLITARIQRNSRPSIKWPEGREVPEPFRRVTVSLDGDKVYDAWKAKTLPEGFDVIEGTHLRLA